MPENPKIPPHNLEAEQSVLGSLLIDREAIYKIMDILTPEDFYREAHKIIYETMLELIAKHEPIDIIALSNKLKERKALEDIGGQSYLSSLSNIVPTSSHVNHYADIVQKKATLRRILSTASELTSLGYDEDAEVEHLLDRAERSVFNVSQKFHKHVFVPIKSLLEEAFERIDEIHKKSGQLRGVPTGFMDLDSVLSGLQKSDLVILAARPSVGKTALALDIARNVAVKSKIPVGIFSLEMSKDQLIDRFLCAEAGVSLWKLRTGHLSHRGEKDDFTRISEAMGLLSEAPIYIDDSAITNIMEIRSKARRLQLEHGLGLIIIDYLQLMEGLGNSENRVQEVATITRSLKGIARELKIPVLALSQLSRAVEMGGGPAIPNLAHLRESGSIEQDADVVLFIYRKKVDRYYANRELKPEEMHRAEIRIAKHRNGPTGVVSVYFNEEKTSFENWTEERVGETEYETVAK